MATWMRCRASNSSLETELRQVLFGQDPAIDHGHRHVGAAGRVDQRRPWVGTRGEVRRVGPDQDQVGPLAWRDRADLGVEAERLGAAAGGHQQHVPRGQRPGAVAFGLERRREAHLVEHVEAVVAGGAVGAQRHADALGPQRDDRGHARTELEVRAGAVEHLDAALGHDRLLAGVDPHAVGGAQPRRGEPELGQVGHVAQAGLCPNEGHLVAVLAGVGVHQDPRGRGLRRDRFEQRPRARHGEPGRQRDADPPIGLPVPAAVQVDAGVEAGAPGLVQPGRRVAAVVHQALADRGADAGRGDRLEHGVGVVHGLHRQHRRRAGPQQLVDGEPRRGGQRRRRVRRFERPHALLEPLEQRQVVGQAPEQGLAQVDVGLDEAGEQVRAAGVDHRVVGLGGFRADRRDPPVTDRHRSLHDVARIVHGEDGGVADQC
jgi:hypothetical protein